MEAGNLGKAPGRRGPGTAGLPWRWQHATLEASIHAAADVPRTSRTVADRAEHGPADLEKKAPARILPGVSGLHITVDPSGALRREMANRSAMARRLSGSQIAAEAGAYRLGHVARHGWPTGGRLWPAFEPKYLSFPDQEAVRIINPFRRVRRICVIIVCTVGCARSGTCGR
jgi:hypothetical protein